MLTNSKKCDGYKKYLHKRPNAIYNPIPKFDLLKEEGLEMTQVLRGFGNDSCPSPSLVVGAATRGCSRADRLKSAVHSDQPATAASV